MSLLVNIVWLVTDVGNIADKLVLVVGLPKRLILHDVVVLRETVVEVPLVEAAVHCYNLGVVLLSLGVRPSDTRGDEVSVVVAVQTAVKHVLVASVVAFVVGLLLDLVLFYLEVHWRLILLPPLDLPLVSGRSSVMR